MQGVEYGSDEEEEDEEEASPPYPSAIEVFDLAENEDLSPLETDPEKLAHKYKEVRRPSASANTSLYSSGLVRVLTAAHFDSCCNS